MMYLSMDFKINWVVILFTQIVATHSLFIHYLNESWNLENLGLGYNLSAVVPGGIYTDLMRHGVIGDVFYGFNDVNTRWVSKTDWNYSTTFTINSQLLAHNTTNLILDGVDTFSKITLNNIEVGVTENMFVKYIFNVKSALQLGTNTLQIQFYSPVERAQLLFEKQAKSYVVPPLCVPKKYNGECHVNHIRKMQASFGWDWGPALPSMGIWKSIYLEGFNSSLIRDVTVTTVLNAVSNHWNIQFNIYLAKNNMNIIQGSLTLEIITEMEKIINLYKVTVTVNEDGDFLITKTISIPQVYVRLWWPNGYGNPNLYPVKVVFTSPNKDEKSVKSFKIGFRTVEIVQKSLTQGRTFYFKVNQIPIFAKGANSIPLNILPELGQNKTTIDFLLKSAKEANMNMLRIWGGGVYESNYYYELADELGIMLWQDFMFACSMYPVNPEFLQNVQNEVVHQVKRLQYHPSIVVWAGNNENEAALVQDWYGTSTNFSLYKRDYVKLYVDTVKKAILKIDNSRSVLISSPSNGIESEKEGYVAKKPQSNFYGDVHYYNYILDGWNAVIYPISRFASEFGYQSLPSINAWLTATNNVSDIERFIPFLTHRQHHPLGYGEILLLINFQLELPDEDSTNFMKAYIFYSQIVQAMSVKVETEYYRTWRSNLNSLTEGLTMGAMFWQLNDVWVAPSWSSIDFRYDWKMLHYFAKKMFAPLIITGYIGEQNNAHIFIVSDLVQPIFNTQVNIMLYSWDSFTPYNETNISLDILPGISQKIYDFPIYSSTSKEYFVYLSVNDANNKSIAPENYIFPTSLKNAAIQIPNITISHIAKLDNSAKNFEINIKSDTIALFVWLESKEICGHFSDNGFLQVVPLHTVYFYSNEVVELEDLKKSLYVTSLLNKEYL